MTRGETFSAMAQRVKVASQGRRVAEADYEIRVQSQNVMCDTQRGPTQALVTAFYS